MTSARADDAADIGQQDDALVGAYNRGDIDAVARHYADEAILVPEGSSSVTGRAEIQKFWKSASEQISNVTTTTKNVQILGPDAAVETGQIGFTLKASETETMTGNYLTVWKKVAGNWEIINEMW